MRAPRLRFNLAANFAGRVGSAVVALVFVPVYIRLLGLEAYGLIGFYANLLVLLNLFDFGLSAAMNREMARLSAAGRREDAADFARTLELCYGGVGLAVGAALLLLSPAIASHWLRAERLPVAVVRDAVALMAVVFAFRWPLSLHAGGLMGLERQVWTNVLSGTCALAQALGAVLVLTFVSRSVTAFFAWQAIVALLQTGAAWFLFWRALAPSRPPRASWRALSSARGFALGVSATTVVMLLLSQIDKLILSKFLPLSQFAGYTLASTAAAAIFLPPAPVSDALFPRYVRLAETGRAEELAALFHLGCQAVGALAFPVAALGVFLARPLVLAWTGQAALAGQIENVVALLSLGAAFNCAMGMMDSLQMAHGDMRTALRARVAALVLVGPAMAYAAWRFGPAGCAAVWLAIYAGYLAVVPTIVLRRWLRPELRRWYLEDVLLPMTAAFACAWALSRWIEPATRLGAGKDILLVWALTSVVTVLAVPRLAGALRGARTAFAAA